MGCASSTAAAHTQSATTRSYLSRSHGFFSPPRRLNETLGPFRQVNSFSSSMTLTKERSNHSFLPQSLGPLPNDDDDDGVDWSEFRLLEPYKDIYWIDHDDITIVRTLPSTYMKTEMATWNGRSVLIKSVDLSKSPAEIAKSRKALISEVTSMVRIQHPNIVSFLGFNLSPQRGIVCVSEFMEQKTLRVHLDTPKAAASMSWATDKITFAVDICQALAYMHGLKPPLIHRNIKADKVLLNPSLRAKLSGFGVSRARIFEDEMTAKIGDIEWSAPELLVDGEDYTEKVDVYSFGIVLTELDTCALPFAEAKSNMHGTDFTNALATGAIRPKLSADCPAVIVRVIKHCLQHDPHLRPTSAKVLDMLNEARTQLLTPPGRSE
ncbi:TKL protein kinase [Aphanomyces astaci]|uniref:TKL protein kinase n=2 Tax=Aphanomyces astaci TaxID=112090 RepID=W4FWK0_APHAT|nr:TKL protein kinase [Aphanomyces astaci]ETV71872.1 TKL protein kinase [Aphanomyces astaci]RQM21492.1 hypothetical protein B5M09_012625 [Aphanomyces astaci]|eukprot:XP_009838721.1 TKL protein kinase [Aphanomyces astaci]